MRLDLFLKANRLVKRRAVARELCEAGRVFVNGRGARPAKEVRPGDVITLSYSSRVVEIEVLGIAEKPKRPASSECYRVISEKKARSEIDSWKKSPS